MGHATSRDGTSIAIYRSGSGPALLLVHGTTADHTRWSGLLPLLEPHFTVYTMDRRGRGGSGDAYEYHVMREAEDVAAVVEAIGEPVFLVAHSYGAVCSLEGALLTSMVRSLVLYEPPLPTGLPLYPPGLPDRMQALVEGGHLESALEAFVREVVKMPEHELQGYRQLPTWKTRIALAPTIPRELVIDRTYRFAAERFAGLETPTLLLLGSDSPDVFRRAVEVVHEALPNSRVVVLPGQRHVAMDTDPELFVREVREFIAVAEP